MTNARRRTMRNQHRARARAVDTSTPMNGPAQQLMPKAVQMCAAALEATSSAAVVQVIQDHATRAGVMRAEVLALALMCVTDEDSRGILHALRNQPVLPTLRSEEV